MNGGNNHTFKIVAHFLPYGLIYAAVQHCCLAPASTGNKFIESEGEININTVTSYTSLLADLV
jgi:hypothetical protein